jgi:hypothetical protein
MAFTYTIEIEGVDVSDAVITPFTVSNGRTNLLEPLGQTSCSLSLFKDAMYAAFAAVSQDPQIASLGAYVIIIGASGSEPIFGGHITDVSSSDEQITFTLVDKDVFKLTRAQGFTLPNGTISSKTLIENIMDSVDASRVVSSTLTNTVRYFGEETKNYAATIRDIIASNETAFGWFQPSEGLQVQQRFDYPSIAEDVMTDAHIVKNYSLIRNISDILNEVFVTYVLPDQTLETWVAENSVSIDAIGVRSDSRSTNLTSESDANKVAKATLAAGAPFGWPVVQCRTNSVVKGFTSQQMLDTFQPNKVLDCSAVTAEGFDDRMFIEQVIFSFDLTIIEAELVLSSSQYSTMPQRWNQIPGQNVVFNGSFESNTTGWQSTSTDYPISRVTTDSVSGVASLRVLHNLTSSMPSGVGARIVNNSTYRIPVNPGQTVQARAYVRNLVGSRTIQMLLRQFADATTNTVTTSSLSITTTSSAWTPLTADFPVTGSNPVFFDLLFRTNDAGGLADAFLVDRVYVTIDGVEWALLMINQPTLRWDDLLYTRI